MCLSFARVTYRSANQLMRQAKKTFPNDRCQIIKMNSVPIDTPRQGDNDIWRPYMGMRLRALSGQADELKQHHAAPSGARTKNSHAHGRATPDSLSSVSKSGSRGGQTPKESMHGQYLSKTDINNLSAFVSDFAIKYLLPHLETKLRLLNGQVRSLFRHFELCRVSTETLLHVCRDFAVFATPVNHSFVSL